MAFLAIVERLYRRYNREHGGDEALARWRELFYCFRCDGVFVLGDTHLTPVGRMRSLLYEAQGRSDNIRTQQASAQVEVVGNDTCEIICEIISQNSPGRNDKFLFWAGAVGPNGSYDAGGSEVFEQQHGIADRPVEDNQAAKDALNFLVSELTNNGWDHIGQGEEWFSQQFQRRIPQSH